MTRHKNNNTHRHSRSLVEVNKITITKIRKQTSKSINEKHSFVLSPKSDITPLVQHK